MTAVKSLINYCAMSTVFLEQQHLAFIIMNHEALEAKINLTVLPSVNLWCSANFKSKLLKIHIT